MGGSQFCTSSSTQLRHPQCLVIIVLTLSVLHFQKRIVGSSTHPALWVASDLLISASIQVYNGIVAKTKVLVLMMSARVVRAEHDDNGYVRATASLMQDVKVCLMICLTATTSVVVGTGIYLAVRGRIAAVGMSVCAVVFYVTASTMILRSRLMDVRSDVLVVHQLAGAAHIPISDVRNVEVHRHNGRYENCLSVRTTDGQRICCAMGGDKSALEDVALEIRNALMQCEYTANAVAKDVEQK